ncbi:MAG: hypothetical protein KGI89_15110, partial [Euryarchaeota archaeon]|nr:hypothetical protein [Euryarchaeota archaeon]
MRTGKTRPRGRARIVPLGLTGLLLIVLLAPFSLATALPFRPSATGHPAIVDQNSGGAQLPCTAASNVSGFAYCIRAINGAGGPANQTVTADNSTAASAMVLSLASTPKLEFMWYCGAPTWTHVSQVLFTMSILGAEVIHDPVSIYGPPSNNYSVCYSGLPLTNRTQIQPLQTLETWSWALSGVFLGSVSFYDDHGQLLGNATTFYVKVLPVYPPFTVFTIPLMLVAVYELYQTVRDLRDLQRARPKGLRKQAAPAAAPSTARAAPAPTAPAPVAAPVAAPPVPRPVPATPAPTPAPSWSPPPAAVAPAVAAPATAPAPAVFQTPTSASPPPSPPMTYAPAASPTPSAASPPAARPAAGSTPPPTPTPPPPPTPYYPPTPISSPPVATPAVPPVTPPTVPSTPPVAVAPRPTTAEPRTYPSTPPTPAISGAPPPTPVWGTPS